MNKDPTTQRTRCELADLIRCYIEHARNLYESRHWMNIRCALAHLAMHARDLTWPALHQAAHDVATDVRSTPNYRRQVLTIWRQFLAHQVEACIIDGAILTRFAALHLRFPEDPDNQIIEPTDDYTYAPERTRRLDPASTLSAFQETLAHLPRRYHAQVELIALTAARPSEVLTLRTCDIDTTITPWLATITRHKTSSRTNKPRYLVLEHRARQLVDPQLTPFAFMDWLFPAPKDSARPMTTNTLAQAIRNTIKRHQLAPWTLYDLRRAAGRLTRMHLGLDSAQALLGHSDARTTERHYAPVDLSKAEGAAKLIEQLLLEERSQ